MGNMSNPLINRWGLNLFWYRFWFNDKNYHLTIHQDTLINKLVHIYLNYGILFPINIFINKYWVNKNIVTNYSNIHNSKYYRIMGFKNLISKEMSYYKERTKTSGIYQSKIWILRYQHWIVINFYCFTPLKKKWITDKKNNTFRHLDTALTSKNYKFENVKRLRFIFFFFHKKINNFSSYYNF